MPGSATRASALDHVVVVLFENRSLDNVLGRLYGPGDGKTFDGVIGKDLSNPIPEWAEHGADRKTVPYGITTDMDSPNPDSGEEWYHTASGHEKMRVCGQLAPGSWPSEFQSRGHEGPGVWSCVLCRLAACRDVGGPSGVDGFEVIRLTHHRSGGTHDQVWQGDHGDFRGVRPSPGRPGRPRS